MPDREVGGRARQGQRPGAKAVTRPPHTGASSTPGPGQGMPLVGVPVRRNMGTMTLCAKVSS